MAKKIKKDVRFYDVVLEETDDDGSLVERVATSDFWTEVFDAIDAITDHNARIARINRVRYFGKVSLPRRPAIRHLQVGRVRDLSDHLERTDLGTGEVQPLRFDNPNERVSEPTFIVPVSGSGRVAILSPGKATRQETIASWLTRVLDLVPDGKEIRFRAVVDPDALARIIGAQGAVSVEFNMDANQPIPNHDGDLSVFDAVENLRSVGPSAGTMSVKFALGYEGTAADRNLIQRMALWVAQGGFARRGEVGLVLEDEDGNIHRETHKIFEDQIVETVSYEVDEDSESNEEIVLDAVARAIQDFRGRATVSGLG
ncbi:MAG: hypothetical protein KF680_11110 [Cryobacterium sp.]|nr:hypothetical protein [Cryobacterium sp.]